ncbi:MAG TPA: CotH kinase family protein, partial [Prolixibacteraceae bacterium]|nr:CotH kinase family protein [Prolixibacteraceae bacterium]
MPIPFKKLVPYSFILLTVFSFTAYAQNLTESKLPIIIIDTKGNQIVDEPKITALMKVLNQPGGINKITDQTYEYDGPIGIEIRGNTSQMFNDKKSFTLETRLETGENNNVSLLGLPAENDWVLYGPYTDKSMIRNVLAYHLGNAQGRWSPHTRYCEVIINGNYRGIYVFTEKIKIDKNRVNIATLKPEDNEGDERTGGYIISIDRDNPGSWNSPFMGRTGSVDVPFTYVDPDYDDLTPTQRDYIREYITDFEYALHGPDFKNPETGYRKYIDVLSFIDYMIITELSRDLDGYRVSVFFHKDKDSKGGKLTMSPFWDYNICFGNADFMKAYDPKGWTEEGIGKGDWYEIPFWWDRLREDPYYETHFKYRWETLRGESFSKENIFARIDSCVQVMGEAVDRNFNRWPILNRKIWPNKYVGRTYEYEVNYLKKWISDRIDWLDSQIDLIEPAFALSGQNLQTDKRPTVEISPNPFRDHLNFRIQLNN